MSPFPVEANGKAAHQAPITWNDAHRHYAILYIRYIQAMRNLEECYDQIVHPQKRRDIRITLDLLITRIYQLHLNLSTFGLGGHQSDFHNLDSYLTPLNLTPEDIEIPVPLYFREKQADEEQVVQNRLLLARCMDELGIHADNNQNLTSKNLLLSHLTRKQAINIIQRVERARQGIQRVLLSKELRADNALRVKNRMGVGLDRSVHTAATIIQKRVRGWLARRRLQREVEEESIFLGMTPYNPSMNEGNNVYDPVAKEAQVRKIRKARQADHELQYLDAVNEASVEINSVVGSELKYVLWEERYEWWIREQQKTGKGPTSLAGYYAALEAEEKKAAGISTPEPDVNSKKNTSTNASRTTTASRIGRSRNDKAPKVELKPVVLESSNVVPLLQECISKYRDIWLQIDESENVAQTHDINLLRANLLPIAKEALKAEVDKELLAYLQNIQNQVKSKKKKRIPKKTTNSVYSRPATSSIPSRPRTSTGTTTVGGKSPAKKTGKKGKKIEGARACAQMTTSSIMSAIIQLGIVYDTSHHRSITDFKGVMNSIGSIIEATGASRDATLQQLRHSIITRFILPLGCKITKAYSPDINSLLLFGPKGSGKTMLAQCIANESHSVWFDLSPATVLSKVRTKADIQKLCYMVFKTALEVQPSVIYIDTAEQYFYKKGKGPKGRAMLLAQFRKSIIAQRKALPPNSRILIIGTTNSPTIKNISVRELCKFFDHNHKGRMWYTPCPDYNTRVALWRHFITSHGITVEKLQSLSKDFNLSLLARVSEGFTAGSIELACKHALTPSRVERFLHSPTARFEMVEFLRVLSKTNYVYQNEYAAFANFALTVSMDKKRIKLFHDAVAIEAEEASKKKDKMRTRAAPKTQ